MQQIIVKDVVDLRPYSRNARTHSDKQIGKIADSIRRFGFNNPILVDREQVIVAGHGRWEAARRLCLCRCSCNLSFSEKLMIKSFADLQGDIWLNGEYLRATMLLQCRPQISRVHDQHCSGAFLYPHPESYTLLSPGDRWIRLFVFSTLFQR